MAGAGAGQEAHEHTQATTSNNTDSHEEQRLLRESFSHVTVDTGSDGTTQGVHRNRQSRFRPDSEVERGWDAKMKLKPCGDTNIFFSLSLQHSFLFHFFTVYFVFCIVFCGAFRCGL